MTYILVSDWSILDAEPPESSDQVFVATEEWQEVRPGQRVPGGLHVRHNSDLRDI